MARGTVIETIKRGDGSAAVGVHVTISLANPNVTAYAGDTGDSVVGKLTAIVTDASGVWSQALEQTNTMLPANSYWRRVYTVDGEMFDDLFTVPGTGSYGFGAVVLPPSSVPTTPLPTGATIGTLPFTFKDSGGTTKASGDAAGGFTFASVSATTVDTPFDGARYNAGAAAYTGPHGWTDAAIQAAIADVLASSAGYGTVVVPPHTWSIATPIRPYSRVRLQGMGRQAPVLQAANGLNDAVIKWIVDNTVQYFALEHLTIHGNKANNTAGSGIHLAASQCQFKGVEVLQCAEHGIHLDAATSGAYTGGDILQDIRIQNCNKSGFRNEPLHGDLYAVLLDIGSCNGALTQEAGIYLGGPSSRVAASNPYACNHGYIVANDDCIISGGMADTNNYAGIYVKPARVSLQISDVMLRSNSFIGTGLWPAIMLGSAAAPFADTGAIAGMQIVGCRFRQQSTQTQHSYGIASDTGMTITHPVITGNDFTGSFTIDAIHQNVWGTNGARVGVNGGFSMPVQSAYRSSNHQFGASGTTETIVQLTVPPGRWLITGTALYTDTAGAVTVVSRLNNDTGSIAVEETEVTTSAANKYATSRMQVIVELTVSSQFSVYAWGDVGATTSALAEPQTHTAGLNHSCGITAIPLPL